MARKLRGYIQVTEAVALNRSRTSKIVVFVVFSIPRCLKNMCSIRLVTISSP